MSAKATGYLELNIAGFDQALKTAKNLMATFAAGFAAFKIGQTFKDGIKDAIDFGKSMETASRQMGGLGAGNLLLVQKALEKTGMGAEEAQGHIADFVRQGRDIKEMFGGADNYAAALSKSSKEYGAQAEVLNRSASKLQTIWNSIEIVVNKSREFFLAMTEQFVGPLQVALDMLKSVDIAGAGERFGKAISNAALTLYGIFKNGDIVETLRLGMTVALQESVNYLVGGFQFVMKMVPGWLISAFDVAMKFLQESLRIISTISFTDSLLYAATQFHVKMLETVNAVAKLLGAGVAFAVMKSVTAIPGLGSVLGIGEEAPSFSEVYNDSEGIVSQDTIDKFKAAADYFGDNASEPLKRLMDQMTNVSDSEGFQKGAVFDTSEDMAALQDIIANGFKTGTEAANNAQKDNTSAATKGVLTSFSGANSKVIADSLAKVGGGGNFLRVGMTLQEKTALDQLRAQRQANDLLETVAKNTKNSKPVLMQR